MTPVDRPAPWARALLRLVVPRARFDDVVGDIEEARGGTRDALATAAAFLFYRVRARWWVVMRWITISDLRFGWRLIRKQPVLSATATLALAAAITVACMGYTFAQQMLFATLPFPRGEHFVRLEIDTPPNAAALAEHEIHARIRDRARTLDHIAAVAPAAGEMSLLLPGGDVDGIRTTYITPDMFRFLPYTPLAGRPLAASDAASGAAAVVLIRESLAQRHFGGATAAVDRTIDLGGYPRTIVGVMPDRFEFPFQGEAWLPLDDRALGDHAAGPVAGPRLLGILREGVSRETAAAELQTIVAAATPGATAAEHARVRVLPFATDPDDIAILFPIVFGVIVLTLLVVVGNVAVLMTARGWARATELAVRTALGGGRARIVGQLTAEVLLLGAAASAAGIAAAVAALRWIDRAYPDIPFWIDLMPRPHTFVFVAGMALVTVTLAGVWPALVVTRGHFGQALQHGGRGASSGAFSRTAGTMITVQIAMAVALLSGAVSMARGFVAYLEGPSQVDADRLLTARVNLPPRSSLQTMTDAVAESARSLPGATAAGIATHVPRRDPPLLPVEVDGTSADAGTRLIRAPGVAITPGFLETLGGHALAGRLLVERDSAESAVPVALVNESFVAQYFDGRNPVGRRILAGGPRLDRPAVWREVVGVVPDLGLSTGDPAAGAGFYVPLTPRPEFRLVIRTTGDPRRLTQPLRAAIAKIDPAIRLREIVPLGEVGADEQAFLAGMASTMVSLGVAALALSIVSVYALLSFAVTRRTREIGVRVALGALPRQVVASVLGSAALYLLLGAAIGTALGVLLMQARVVLAFRMPTTGAWVVPAVILPLVAAGVIACWVPARRALAVQPADALRAE